MKNIRTELNEIICQSGSEKRLLLAVIDHQGSMHFVNTVFLKTLHLTHVVGLQKKFFEFIDQDRVGELRALLSGSRKTNRPATLPAMRIPGSELVVNWQVFHLPGEGRFLLAGTLSASDPLAADHFTPEQEIIQDLPLAIVVCNPHAVIQASNLPAAEMLNVKHCELAGTILFEHLWVTIEEETTFTPFEKSLPMTALMDGKAISHLLMSIRIPGRGQRWFKFSLQPLFNPGEPKPYMLICSFTDITPVQQTVLKNQQRRQHALTVLDQVANFSWLMDSQGCMLYANRSLLRHFGVAEIQLPEKTSAILPVKFCDVINHLQQQLQFRDQSSIAYCELQSSDGRSRNFGISLHRTTSNSGALMFVGEAHDVSVAVLAEQQLTSSNAQLALANALPVLMWHWNIAEDAVKVYEKTDFLRHERPEQSLENWLLTVHENDRGQLVHSLRGAMKNLQPFWDCQYKMIDGGRTTKMIFHRAVILYNGRTAQSVVGSLQDITLANDLKHHVIREKLEKQQLLLSAFVREVERSIEYQQPEGEIKRMIRYLKKLLVPPEAPKNSTAVTDADTKRITAALTAIKNISWTDVMRSVQNDQVLYYLRQLLDEEDQLNQYPVLIAS